MQISCPKCTKNFVVKDDLIPDEGRLLQCGNCENKWFFKKKTISTKIINDSNIKNKKLEKVKIKVKEKKITSKGTNLNDTNNIDYIEKNISNKINYFKILLVFVISFISLIIIIDTFKNQIFLIYPDIYKVLENLYESLRDIALFIKDLIN